ncbi:MAG: glycosyltransferase family 2 protein [Synergistales bacterium]|nr:glycosyltransferase family 2 protein [Synergistales bacterium]
MSGSIEKDTRHMDVSIVIPLKDEEENLIPLSREINEVFGPCSWDWECVWVDDGSTDSTQDELRSLCEADCHHRFISFLENAGQSAALFAGFKESRGKIIATMDGDGQNDPSDLPGLIEAILCGECDMANGYRANRKDSGWRKLCSRIGNGFRNYITGIRIRDVGCSTRAFRRECVGSLPKFRGMHRFIPTIAAMEGFELKEYPVNHRSRKRGLSKYTAANRALVGILDCLGIRWLNKRIFRYTISDRSSLNKRCDHD